MRWLDAARARLRLLRVRSAESRMNHEFRLHIDMETEHLMRTTGLARDEARRRALVAFGGIETHKEALRDGRGLAWLGGFALDLKLAVRLLVRYPWLTVVGGVAMAFGIAAGVGAFEARTQFINPSLPLDEGSRIVGVRNWDASLNRAATTAASDFVTWRDTLELVEDVSAARTFSRNLITDDGRSEPVAVAAMSPSAFRVTRVPPLLCRTLVAADDEPGAPSVIVIGYDIWTQRFSRDPGIVGRLVRLGRDRSTVVGVMPEGFAFPVAHGAWVPLRSDASGSARDESQGLLVFARLARHASRTQAQAELSALGARMASDSPGTHAFLRPQLLSYTRLFFDSVDVRIGLELGNAFVVMLLVLVSANVALLMFARAATRESEIAVRSALGAGRARIVAQLFIEALVLASLAGAVGLAAARFALRSLLTTAEANSGRPLPFWMTDSLTPTTVLYAGALMIVSAVIIGVLPAMNMTGRRQQERLRQTAAGGGGFRFSGVWTAVIASQIAATLTFPATAFLLHRWVVAGQTRDAGFPAGEYLSALLELDRETASGIPPDAAEQTYRSRLHSRYAELEQRLIAEPEVVAVTIADRLPGTAHPRWRIETDGDAASGASTPVRQVAAAAVAPSFFDVLGVPVLAGRHFTTADLDSDLGVVVVNQSFVHDVFGGQNPIGRSIRRSPEGGTQAPGPWLEIVGVVVDLGMGNRDASAGLYRPVSADTASALRMAIRLRGNPASFAARLRSLASAVEPTLQIHELMPLDEVGASDWIESQYLSRVLTALSAIALLLSLTAIYSAMAFTVSRRTREIGLRVALGADRRRIVATVVRRPLQQVGVGIVAGGILVTLTFVGVTESTLTGTDAALIAAYSIVMMGVCLLACIVPTRRALRVEPARALAADG